MSEARIDRLDEDIRDIKATLARLEPMIIRIDATLPHLATKAELADGLGSLRVELANKPSRLYMWGVMAAITGAYTAALAAIGVLLAYLPVLHHAS
jgi:hypothetical protein